MESKEFYRLKADLLKRKYGRFAEEFKQYTDDRMLIPNMLDQLLEACKVMEGIENAFICVAFNERFREREAEMEEIVTRCSGMIYNGKWQGQDESDVRLTECVYDITATAYWLIDHQHIEVEDSRELFATILFLAQQFEAGHKVENEKYDYMSEIEEFATHKLCELYGRKE